MTWGTEQPRQLTATFAVGMVRCVDDILSASRVLYRGCLARVPDHVCAVPITSASSEAWCGLSLHVRDDAIVAAPTNPERQACLARRGEAFGHRYPPCYIRAFRASCVGNYLCCRSARWKCGLQSHLMFALLYEDVAIRLLQGYSYEAVRETVHRAPAAVLVVRRVWTTL